MNIAKSLLLLAFAGFATTAGAQSSVVPSPEAQSAWIVYKPINRIANKQLFDSHLLYAAHLNVASPGYPSPAMTKAVHRAEQQTQAGNIPSRGYPSWTISKPLHRK